MDTINPTRCPICQEPNVCAVEKAKLPGIKPERCWCMDAVFTPDVIKYLTQPKARPAYVLIVQLE